VGESHTAFTVIYFNRLAVVAAVSARGAVSYMPHRYSARRQTGKHIGSEYFSDKTRILVRGKQSVVIDNNTAAFLTAVLKRVKSVAGKRRYIACLW
jgi:hypothetical protein